MTMLAQREPMPHHGRRPIPAGMEVPHATPQETDDHRNQRRLVDATPIQVPTASKVIQLVNEITVMTAGIPMHQELAGGVAEHQRRGSECESLLESLAGRSSG